MPIELELPPVVEIDDTTDKIEDIPDMIAHLYRWGLVTLCGIPAEQDPHGCFHKAQGVEATRFLGEDVCPICGAPCCPTCHSLA